MNVVDRLAEVLKELKLSGVAETLELRQAQAVEENLSYLEFVYRLLSDEVDWRRSKSLERRVHRAGFDQVKYLEDFEFGFNPKIPKAKVLELATCSFVARKENVALIGPAGVGKSHLAQALGVRACRAGYNVLYMPADRLVAELRASKADDSYEAVLARLVKPHLLIIDDLGLRPLVGDGPVALYDIIRLRYERGSIIITSNRAIEEWYPLFRDDLLASAALDRFCHHLHVVVMEGRSYRTARRHARPGSGRQSSPKHDDPEQGKKKSATVAVDA